MVSAVISTPAADTIPARIVGQPPVSSTRPLSETLPRLYGPALKWLSGAGVISRTAVLTPAADTIPAPIVGQPPLPPTHRLAGRVTRQSGPAMKCSSGADLITPAPSFSTRAGDTIPARIVGQPPARP